MLFLNLALLFGLLVGSTTATHNRETIKDRMEVAEARMDVRTEAIENRIEEYLSSLSESDLMEHRMHAFSIISDYVRGQFQGSREEFLAALPGLVISVARDLFKEVLQDFDQEDVNRYLNSYLVLITGPFMDIFGPMKEHMATTVNESVKILNDYASGNLAETPEQVLSKLRVIQDTFQDHLAGAMVTFLDHFSDITREADIDSYARSLLSQVRVISIDHAMAIMKDIVDNLANEKRPEKAIREEL